MTSLSRFLEASNENVLKMSAERRGLAGNNGSRLQPQWLHCRVGVSQPGENYGESLAAL